MSQPSIPNITPVISITKRETITLLLSSIAMNELSMSHIINAEAEKIQAFVHYANHSHSIKTREFIQFNSSVSKLLEDVNMEQYLGLNKLDRIVHLIDNHFDHSHCNNCNDNEDCGEDNQGLEDFEE